MAKSTAFSTGATAYETASTARSNDAEERAWRRALAEAIRDPLDLVERLRLPADLAGKARRAARTFALLVPESFLARMQPGDPADPLLRQVLPLEAEDTPADGYVADPLREASVTEAPGLLRKYDGRALLVATGACAIHCRYCFRRHFPYEGVPKGLAAWEPALQAIAEDQSIEEVILSGGDPLVLPDHALRSLIERLDVVRHIRTIRVHTRLPVVLPERVTGELLRTLRATRSTIVVVLHANHAAELSGDCAAAIERLAAERMIVLNQAVLLRGVNDSQEALADLSRRLVELRVLPYYLHQLDPVAGAAHFHVPESRGRELIEELRATLPGYAVPRHVREEPGAASKIAL